MHYKFMMVCFGCVKRQGIENFSIKRRNLQNQSNYPMN